MPVSLLPSFFPMTANPPKKAKWYWNALGIVLMLWCLGGVNVLLLRDIPLLLFIGTGIGLFCLPMARWFGRPPRHWITFVWSFGVLTGMYALLLFVIPPFSISRQTTWLTEPRSKELYGIDYAAVIEKQLDPGVLPGDNGFRLLTETLGRPFFGENFEEKHWVRVCQYLDLPPEIEPKRTFIGWWEYTKALQEEEGEIISKDEVYEERLRPYSAEAIPIVRRWLDENEAALDLFVAAAGKRVLYVPPMFDGLLMEAICINDHLCREMARGLMVRVRYRLAVGETNQAWDDVLVMYRLTELHRQAIWNQVSSLVNDAIVRIAYSSAEEVLFHSEWTSDEIRQKADEIVPFLQPLSEDEIKMLIRNERFSALDSMQRLLEEEAPQDFWDWFKRKNLRASVRRGYAMVEINQRFDEMEQQFFSDTPVLDVEMDRDFIRLALWYGKVRAIPIMVGRIMSDLQHPVFDSHRTSIRTRHANVLLVRLVFALEAFKRDNGGVYPDKLADLQGRYIDEVPLDPFSGEPFRYVLKQPEDGRPELWLYSVGPNGLDDEGRNWNDFPKGDDVRRILN